MNPAFKEEKLTQFMELGPEYGQWKIDRHIAKAFLSQTIDELQAEKEKALEKLRKCLSEAVDLMEDVRAGEYKPDSFTTQPWKNALPPAVNTTPMDVPSKNMDLILARRDQELVTARRIVEIADRGGDEAYSRECRGIRPRRRTQRNSLRPHHQDKPRIQPLMIYTSDTTTQLTKALIAFQKEVGTIKKDAVNPHFKNTYASLAAIIEAIKEPLARNGLSYVQFPEGMNGLATRLMHESGEWMESTFTMTPAKNDPQGQGSAITYQRRYSLGAVLGLATEEDDDGNAASAPQAKEKGKVDDLDLG